MRHVTRGCDVRRRDVRLTVPNTIRIDMLSGIAMRPHLGSPLKGVKTIEL